MSKITFWSSEGQEHHYLAISSHNKFPLYFDLLEGTASSIRINLKSDKEVIPSSFALLRALEILKARKVPESSWQYQGIKEYIENEL